MNAKILLTGIPKSGKTTLLHKLINDTRAKIGFITVEVKENDERIGFKIVTSTGDEAILASTKINTPIRVSRYFVNIENLERVLPKIETFNKDDVLYIDEIGEMELYSDKFKGLVRKYLDSTNTFIATVSKIYDDDLIRQIKNEEDIEIIEINPGNREMVYENLKERLLITS